MSNEQNIMDPFRGLGVLVTLKKTDDFLKVVETLTRIGVASKQDRILYQSCHILHKRGQYAILSFKELFKIDGKPSTLSDEDIARRNTIANILAEWELVELVDPNKSKDLVVPVAQLKIVKYKEKHLWKLEPNIPLEQKSFDDKLVFC